MVWCSQRININAKIFKNLLILELYWHINIEVKEMNFFEKHEKSEIFLPNLRETWKY